MCNLLARAGCTLVKILHTCKCSKEYMSRHASESFTIRRRFILGKYHASCSIIIKSAGQGYEGEQESNSHQPFQSNASFMMKINDEKEKINIPESKALSALIILP